MSPTVMEALKLIAAFLFGGLGGQLLAEYFRRRGGRLQTVTLIERVNRQVHPNLKDITLARVVATDGQNQLEQISDLREYQLTLRNTSNIHLQNAEIQFEFPADDVQSYASRPARSQTALISQEAFSSEPYKKAFRWRIPYLPAGDSVEFTFQALAPPSDRFIAALYNVDRVVIERVVNEPRPKRDKSLALEILFPTVALTVAVGMLGSYFWKVATDLPTIRQEITASECRLLMVSDAHPSSLYGPDVWMVTYRVLNIGESACTVTWPPVLADRTLAPQDETVGYRNLYKKPQATTVYGLVSAKDGQKSRVAVNSYSSGPE